MHGQQPVAQGVDRRESSRVARARWVAVLGIANGGGFTATGIAQAIPAAVVIGGAIVWFL
ncbi:hypothetical protein [Halonotius sp. GCM10025705]|uniref:hypothetical protein n=1 Tax=Halonotius sp. GCM10025705 TaxID=3252678 RepID=UPI00360D3CF1